jgi:Fur family ferric uptake transcriptional regulator
VVVEYVSDIEQRVAERLEGGGVRFTQARRLAVRALARAGGPRTASELHDTLRDQVPLSSLYRTLAVLEDAGVLDRSHDPQGIARYEPSEWLLGHHHHLVCVECGAVEDIQIDPVVESEVSALVARIAGDAGYVVTDHKIDIEGICRTCAR